MRAGRATHVSCYSCGHMWPSHLQWGRRHAGLRAVVLERGGVASRWLSTVGCDTHGGCWPAPTSSPYLAAMDGTFKMASCDTGPPPGAPIDAGISDWREISDRYPIHKLQRSRLSAKSPHSILLVFQAMDAAGKDSTIRKVLHGVDPNKLSVHSFLQPSAEEKSHDFLWRTVAGLPGRGRIGVFNRSYYEDVLVLRVHPSRMEPESLLPEHRDVIKLPPLVPHALWSERLESIHNHELHLARNGTIIRKFMLNISNEMQGRRLLGRLQRPDKVHKFSASDLPERQHWENYQQAYEEAIAATSRPWAPWYVVPADNKLYMQDRVADIIFRTLKALPERNQSIHETAQQSGSVAMEADGLRLQVDLEREAALERARNILVKDLASKGYEGEDAMPPLEGKKRLRPPLEGKKGLRQASS